jgi:class 3 adenylate cyclase/HAMP domain-containing protein
MPEKSVGKMNPHQPVPQLKRVWWILPSVLFWNLAVLGLVVTYTWLNLFPYAPPHDASQFEPYRETAFYLAFLLPTLASALYLHPILKWLASGRPAGKSAPAKVVERSANAPLTLATFTLASWAIMSLLLFLRLQMIAERFTIAMWMHFIVRPLLAGLIAAAAVFFASESLCRAHMWPVLLGETQIEGNPRLRRIRVWHRLLLLWLTISFLPLSVVALIAYMRMEMLDPVTDPLLLRVMWAIVLVAGSSALVGAGLSWLLARSLSRPLLSLEKAMASLRSGNFRVRESVSATDEVGSLTEGFNLMTRRLSESYEALQARNRELAEALDRIVFLESVKRGLDRFVPDTVRRAIEANPETPDLQKRSKDVTVLFLDIEGYSRLSEQLSRSALNTIVERYFSLFLSIIRQEGGDINETAGDGLMIIFQEGTIEQHAAAAVRAALGIRERTAAANREAHLAHPPIAVNMGVSSGICDLGSTRLHGVTGERWTFTATGPVTNLAARLCDRATQGQVLLSAETARRVRASFTLRSLGPIALKNISTPEEVWEIREAREE